MLDDVEVFWEPAGVVVVEVVKVLTPVVGLVAATPEVVEVVELDTEFAGFVFVVVAVVDVAVAVAEVDVGVLLVSWAAFAGVLAGEVAGVLSLLHVTLTVNWESHWTWHDLRCDRGGCCNIL
jgi:hypothetical protein